MSQTALASPHHAPNACLLIDFDNVTLGIRSDLQTELKNLLSSDIVKGKVAVQRAYADWRRYPQYVVPLTESSIDLIFATDRCHHLDDPWRDQGQPGVGP